VNGPRLMCAACGEEEVGLYSPICERCENDLRHAEEQRQQDPRDYEDRQP
jgi:hypothetical protein